MRRILLPLALVPLLAGCGARSNGGLGPGPLLPEPVPLGRGVAAGTLPAATDESADGSQAARSPAAKSPTASVLPSDDRYRIRTGNVLTISILGEPEMTRSIPVGPDGRISYYVAHDVVAAGRTFEELREQLRRRLLTHFKAPEVAVFGEAYKGNTVTVLGTVAKPGEYMVRSDTRLLDVLAMAGGIARRAYWASQGVTVELPDLRRAFLLRGAYFVEVNFTDLLSDSEEAVARSNVRVLAGDRIYLPSSTSLDNRVIVLGEVRNPRVIRFQRDISFLEAVADAGGAVPSAWEKRAFVVRGSLSRPTVIPVNMRQVAIGATPDVSLRSGDIVYLPKTALGKASEIARQVLPLLQDVSYARDVTR